MPRGMNWFINSPDSNSSLHSHHAQCPRCPPRVHPIYFRASYTIVNGAEAADNQLRGGSAVAIFSGNKSHLISSRVHPVGVPFALIEPPVNPVNKEPGMKSLIPTHA